MNVTKIEGLNYTLGSGTITFTSAPILGSNNIELRRGNFYSLIKTLTGSAATEFGRSVAINNDATLIYVGQPLKTANSCSDFTKSKMSVSLGHIFGIFGFNCE